MDIYEQLSRVAGFDRDTGNAEKNWKKHGVTVTECEEVFLNTPLLVEPDEAHSGVESRFYVLGLTNAERYLFIVFTLRGDLIRVVSARDMHRKERKIFESA